MLNIERRYCHQTGNGRINGLSFEDVFRIEKKDKKVLIVLTDPEQRQRKRPQGAPYN